MDDTHIVAPAREVLDGHLLLTTTYLAVVPSEKRLNITRVVIPSMHSNHGT